MIRHLLLPFFFANFLLQSSAFTAYVVPKTDHGFTTSVRSVMNDESVDMNPAMSRRNLIKLVATANIAAASVYGTGGVPTANAVVGETLERCLYLVLRVREATQQEQRLIKSGKFKDVQRANVKLAVKFMIENYRLSDNVVAAAAYLSDGQSSMKAIDAGQAAVQDLQTILEYYDAAQVQNIKVGEDSMAGKEKLVLKGLEAARDQLDTFLAYFPEATVKQVRDKIKEENDLNEKEFDPSLGQILNIPSP